MLDHLIAGSGVEFFHPGAEIAQGFNGGGGSFFGGWIDVVLNDGEGFGGLGFNGFKSHMASAKKYDIVRIYYTRKLDGTKVEKQSESNKMDPDCDWESIDFKYLNKSKSVKLPGAAD